MTYVVTQPCCADASCVVACPVNCIHPTPDEPGFAEAEMLYVDPASCVGCGACATACPADAIVPESALSQAQKPFVALNAAFYDAVPEGPRTPMLRVPKQRRIARRGAYRVAVIGAGPAGLYAADELLAHPEISVDVYDRLPTPYGLVRYGVAPDHPQTKQVTGLFAHIESLPGFRYVLGVDVGRDLSHDELAAAYDAVIYCVGASADRALGVPGEDLPGSLSATDVVAWYNGHPDQRDLEVRLDHERAVVIGNGNVALDVARILTLAPEQLRATDIATGPWEVLRDSAVREVVVLGRRGPAHSSFTVPELIGLAGLPDLNVIVDTGGAPIAGDAAMPGEADRLRLLSELAQRPAKPGRRTIVLRFHTTVEWIAGDHRAQSVQVLRGRDRESIETTTVLRAIGYRGTPVAGLPFDPDTATVPHQRGRVRPGVYVAGWIKRGANGFIGTNKACAEQTVGSLLDDLDAGALAQPVMAADELIDRVRSRQPGVVDLEGWRAIDREERTRGLAVGAPRVKITDPAKLADAARPTPAGRRWLPGRLRVG